MHESPMAMLHWLIGGQLKWSYIKLLQLLPNCHLYISFLLCPSSLIYSRCLHSLIATWTTTATTASNLFLLLSTILLTPLQLRRIHKILHNLSSQKENVGRPWRIEERLSGCWVCEAHFFFLSCIDVVFIDFVGKQCFLKVVQPLKSMSVIDFLFPSVENLHHRVHVQYNFSTLHRVKLVLNLNCGLSRCYTIHHHSWILTPQTNSMKLLAASYIVLLTSLMVSSTGWVLRSRTGFWCILGQQTAG